MQGLAAKVYFLLQRLIFVIILQENGITRITLQTLSVIINHISRLSLQGGVFHLRHHRNYFYFS